MGGGTGRRMGEEEQGKVELVRGGAGRRRSKWEEEQREKEQGEEDQVGARCSQLCVDVGTGQRAPRADVSMSLLLVLLTQFFLIWTRV